jgi:hypothetical protein
MLKQEKDKNKASLFSIPMDKFLSSSISEWQRYDMALKEKTIMDHRRSNELSKGKFGSWLNKESLYSPTYLLYIAALAINAVFLKPQLRWSGISYPLVCLVPYSYDVGSI